jgi:uncharacterized protein YjbI with pentapeptide repeats
MIFKIRNCNTGNIIYQAEAESFTHLIEAAVKAGADLCGVNLSEVNLSGVNLHGVNLHGANMYETNLYEANLSRADLHGANLRRSILRKANLCSANLYEADLYEANLSEANLSEANITLASLPENFPVARLDFGGWSIFITSTHTTIGCQKHPNSDWLKWSPKDVDGFSSSAKRFWKQHGSAIKIVIKDVQSQAKLAIQNQKQKRRA